MPKKRLAERRSAASAIERRCFSAVVTFGQPQAWHVFKSLKSGVVQIGQVSTGAAWRACASRLFGELLPVMARNTAAATTQRPCPMAANAARPKKKKKTASTTDRRSQDANVSARRTPPK